MQHDRDTVRCKLCLPALRIRGSTSKPKRPISQVPPRNNLGFTLGEVVKPPAELDSRSVTGASNFSLARGEPKQPPPDLDSLSVVGASKSLLSLEHHSASPRLAVDSPSSGRVSTPRDQANSSVKVVEQEAEAHHLGRQRHPSEPITCIVVEDEPFQRELYRMMLPGMLGEGSNVVCLGATETEVLGALRAPERLLQLKPPPSMVILDWMLDYSTQGTFSSQ